jgi:putative endonuclease
MFFLYVLRCRDGTLYTGYTNDLEKRLAVHNNGLGSKYVRSRLPAKLVLSKAFPTKSEAMKAEAYFKRLPRKEKLRALESHRCDASSR